MSEKVFEALRERVKSEPYAKMLGLELVKVESGYALIRMAFTERHHNIYGRCHGGAIFSLIDEAFQIASNSSGKIEIALNVSVSYMKAPSRRRCPHGRGETRRQLPTDQPLPYRGPQCRRRSHGLVPGHGLPPGRARCRFL